MTLTSINKNRYDRAQIELAALCKAGKKTSTRAYELRVLISSLEQVMGGH